MVFDPVHGCVRGEWPDETPADIAGTIMKLERLQMPIYRSYRKVHPSLVSGGFTPNMIAHVYNFPRASGHGQTIGIISLGGGVTQANVDALFALYGQVPPKVEVVLVDGASNSPDGPNGADGENYLDIVMAGGVAPGATIKVFLAPNTEQGFIDAFQTAINANVDVITCSWGSAEDNTGAAAMQAMSTVLKQAAAKNITVFAAAGDNGSGDGEPGTHVDYPASDPNIIGCGGTTLLTSGMTISQERVWNDGSAGGSTGGGISAFWPKPSFQANVVGGARRCVPDVAGNADPNTGYLLLVDGTQMVIGGTSAVAPLWAGLTARLNQLLGKRIGNFLPTLYKQHGRGCRDITVGNNGAFDAKVGYDECTGWGSPHGSVLLTLLTGSVTPPALQVDESFDVIMDELAKAHANDAVALPIIQRVKVLGDELITAMTTGADLQLNKKTIL